VRAGEGTAGSEAIRRQAYASGVPPERRKQPQVRATGQALSCGGAAGRETASGREDGGPKRPFRDPGCADEAGARAGEDFRTFARTHDDRQAREETVAGGAYCRRGYRGRENSDGEKETCEPGYRSRRAGPKEESHLPGTPEVLAGADLRRQL